MQENNRNGKTPLTQEAYDVIKRRIVDLHYRPGEILFTQQVANELNLSRTPVREALVKLVQDGLVVQTDSRKFQIAFVTKENIVDIYNLRQGFEEIAITNIFPALSANDIELLQQMNDRMSDMLQQQNIDGFFKLDNEFHYFFISKNGNRFMENFVNQLMDHQQRIRYITVYVVNRMQITISEHQAIIDCIKARDLPGTLDSAKRHIRNVENETLSFLDSSDYQRIISIQKLKLR